MQPKLILFSLFVLTTILLFAQYKKVKESKYTFLALGDSYTIGERVPPNQNFPNQTIDLLRKAGFNFNSPDILARTGWTTDELQLAIDNLSLSSSYNIVTLLIGVNDQYRGYDIKKYGTDFEKLLKRAIGFADNNTKHVFIISIPDWSITPFAQGRNRNKIAREIDAFNAINKEMAVRYHVNYIDITLISRKAAGDVTLVADDGLHPSAAEYAEWAEQLSRAILQQLQ